jgi:hypothetical protein
MANKKRITASGKGTAFKGAPLTRLPFWTRKKRRNIEISLAEANQ